MHLYYSPIVPSTRIGCRRGRSLAEQFNRVEVEGGFRKLNRNNPSYLLTSNHHLHTGHRTTMTDPAPDPRSTSAIMDLILPLSLSHPSVSALLELQPLARPSTVSHSHLTKFVGRVNLAVLGREGESGSRIGSGIAGKLVLDDEEGWVMSEYGKGWVTICLTELAVGQTGFSYQQAHRESG